MRRENREQKEDEEEEEVGGVVESSTLVNISDIAPSLNYLLLTHSQESYSKVHNQKLEPEQ